MDLYTPGKMHPENIIYRASAIYIYILYIMLSEKKETHLAIVLDRSEHWKMQI